jgi:hypothetical protein
MDASTVMVLRSLEMNPSTSKASWRPGTGMMSIRYRNSTISSMGTGIVPAE